jgi:heptosyltransferase-2
LKKPYFLTKVLIIRFSSIGDIVLTTPVIRNLKKQMHGEVEIHYLTKKRFASIVESNPHISRVYSIEKSTNEVRDHLKAEHYHYVIDLHRNLRSSRVKSALKVLSFSFDKLNFQKWLWVNLGINKMPKVHIVDRYMACIKAFGIENDNEGLDFFIPARDEVNAKELPASHRQGFVIIGIGAAHWRKKPRKEGYLQLCNSINRPIILLGGPAEADLGDELAHNVGDHVWNGAGKFSLNQSASLIRQSDMVICPDTGIMHIAAAFKKPIISIWGATVPGFGMSPYQNENLNEFIQADHLSKRPCSKLGTRCKYRECRCIDELPLERVHQIMDSQKELSAQ